MRLRQYRAGHGLALSVAGRDRARRGSGHDHQDARQPCLFDRGALEALGQAKDNNERLEWLHRIRTELLPLYDDLPAVAPDVIRKVAEAIKQARTSPAVPMTSALGDLDGRTAEHVTDEALQIIDGLHFVDISFTFRVLCHLYLTAVSDEERKRISQSFEALARNDVNVWKQVGFGVQRVLYDEIQALPENEKAELRPVIISLCELFLNPELQGTTWHFESVSLHRGAVVASEGYAEFRRKVMSMLCDLYRTAESVTDKLVAGGALSTAMRLPMDEARTELIEMVLADTKTIVEFFMGTSGNDPLEIIEHLEHAFLFLYRQSRGFTTEAWGDAINAKATEVMSAIEAYRDKVNTSGRFVKFKTFVGYESVFSAEWEGDAMDVEGPQTYRAAEVKKYAESVTDENAEDWYELIKLCAAADSNDKASFGESLVQLTTKRPDIVDGYLQKDDGVLDGFLPAILSGFEKSARPERGLAIVKEWTESGKRLAAIAYYLRFADNTSPDLVVQVGEQSIKRKDVHGAMRAITAIVARQLSALTDTLFLPIMRMLTEQRDTRWTREIYYLRPMGAFIGGLSEEQSQAILDNLVFCSRIDHDEEWILREIAKRYPAIVWHFFKRRLDREGAGTSSERYEAVPYHMTELNKPLAIDARLAVRVVRSWYTPDDHLFEFTGGRILHNVFPACAGEFEAELIALARSGNDDDLKFVIRVIRSYHGRRFLHEICKVIVEALPEDDRRLDEVEIILESTGTVAGRFGLVQAYQGKKEEVQHWLDDERPKVRAFAERYLRTLDRSIGAEQRRSETDYELSRRDWEEE